MLLHHQFIKTAKRYASKTAVIDKSTDTRLSFRKTLIASLILSKKLHKSKSRTVGIMVPTSAGCFISILGTLMAGKIPVMINYSTHAQRNCEYARHMCGFTTILTSKKLLEKIGCKRLSQMQFLEDVLTQTGTGEKVGAALIASLPFALLTQFVSRGPETATAALLFTSGSEKEPRAVMLSHRNITANLRDIRTVFALTHENRVMCVLPLFHVFGYTVNFWLPLTTGMTAVTYANPVDYKTIPSIVRTEKTDVMAATPTFFAGYLRFAKKGDFERLKIPVAGADKVPHKVREEYATIHGVTLYEGYGTTETSPVVSTNTPKANRPGSIGKPLPNVEVKIVDIASSQKLSPGNEGKILVRGENVMEGYYENIEETSVRISDGWYDTGDMGMLDTDGYLWHRGRLRRFVKIGGEMVSLPKVESEIDKLVEDDTEICVVGIADEIKGVKLVCVSTHELDQREMIKKLRHSLPPIALPKIFIKFDELPKMGSGKVDFRSIEKRAEVRLHNG